mmetsp:Transcript_12150/g.17607  ORF Transcript_12150/g.17607 Transcript_12150/m.17607 type:complete len:92 (+) Transcript_12150:1756-2031(+)
MQTRDFLLNYVLTGWGGGNQNGFRFGDYRERVELNQPAPPLGPGTRDFLYDVCGRCWFGSWMNSVSFAFHGCTFAYTIDGDPVVGGLQVRS